MSKTVGIDLGTTNSLVAVVENGRPYVLARGDERLVPSVVGLSDDGSIIVGQAALNQYVLAPERTIRSIKRKMGSDETVKLGDREYTPAEISSFILRHLKTMAEEVLGEKVERAVITVPAFFNDVQRQLTKQAGELAGLEVLRIINEPTAAALAYGVEKQSDQFLLVYDLGGGTFDVSVIEQQGDILEVRASHGNVNLGGDDFDERILQHLLAHLSNEHRYDFKEDRRALARLNRAAERAKMDLSSAPFARAAEEFLARYDGQIAHLDTELSRVDFERMIEDLLESTLDSIDRALNDAQLKPEQIQRILLVGGSTRIPRVSEMIEARLNLQPAMEINPDEAVALGAAVQAAIVNGETVSAMLIDVAPHSLGIAVAEEFFGQIIPGGFRPIIRRNTTIPTTRAEVFHTITPQQTTVNVEVYQGENPVAAENTHLGNLLFKDIPPAPDPRDLRELIVEFSYNLNGIVEVTARDHKGERREMMTVSSSTAKRDVSEPEGRTLEMPAARFEEKLERDIERALESAHELAGTLTQQGRQKDAAKVLKMHEALAKAYASASEADVRKAIDQLENLLYDLG